MTGATKSTGTSPWVSDPAPPVVVIANPESRRVELLQAALRQLGRAPARVLSYLDLLDDRIALAQNIPPGSIVKVDSPGRNFEVEKRILRLGQGHPATAAYASATAEELNTLPFRKGEILWPRQWYAGYGCLLRQIDQDLNAAPPHTRIGDPADIERFFDKARCQAFLASQGIPVPATLAPPGDPICTHADLLDRMACARMTRVFLKLTHGSSASGVVAFQVQGAHQRATTTVEMQQDGPALRLFNSRRIRTYTDPADIRRLIDALCRHCAHVEQWIPKAGMAGSTFDLRVLGIAGKPRHVVVRTSKTPITNLHLLNARGNLDAVRARAGDALWSQVLSTCTRVLALFPHSHCIGLDVLIRADWRAHAVLELNAFGDLLPGITDAGHDAYAAQLEDLRAEVPA